MDNVTISFFIFIFLTSSFTSCMALRKVFSKKLLEDMTISNSQKREKIYQHKNKITIIIKLIMVVYIVLSMTFVIIPGILDLPILFTRNYAQEICIIKESYKYKTDLWVHMITDNGQSISIMVLDSSYNQGEKYLVYYLPHIKFGTLVPIQTI